MILLCNLFDSKLSSFDKNFKIRKLPIHDLQIAKLKTELQKTKDKAKVMEMDMKRMNKSRNQQDMSNRYYKSKENELQYKRENTTINAKLKEVTTEKSKLVKEVGKLNGMLKDIKEKNDKLEKEKENTLLKCKHRVKGLKGKRNRRKPVDA